MTRSSLSLDAPLYDYLLRISLKEHPVLQELREITAQHPAARMQIAPEQGQLMAWLVQLMGAKKTLDIGVFTGYSALVVALALPEDGKVIACDRDPRPTAIAQTYWEKAGVAEKIELRLAPALETLDSLLADDQAGTFDFAFIDADKGNYLNYFERSLKLLRVGGVIAVDNVLWSGRVADPADQDKRTEKIRAFNEALYNDPRICLTVLPVADGLTLACKL
ncbi:SAM-dependent methyltransferase [Picosynechococcus sp. PCC 7003]|uniref:class I SAM-dependent methyltransferase n=1 Tax=Picosynechococcus sp. PCC 7003 TaxID=374981 RepID=UPI000810572B|nr:class I SAM-dependent methyltransferase [Picosynechococcus sp. PCC 7003]ANV83586.1 SAM-dependent methyltransferase [Picosynechococcus sp. PCC 7003]